MDQTCAKCGKKIGLFAREPLVLCNERVLCYDCSEPIKADYYALNRAQTVEQFSSTKSELLAKCDDLYDDSITADIIALVDGKYVRTGLAHVEQQEKRETYIENYMVTTGYDFNGYMIKKYTGVVSGQVVLGTGFLSELEASFADFFGEEANRFSNKLEAAKAAAIAKLVAKSDEKGGNALIGVDFDYITFSGNMMGVIANGTSVVIEKVATSNP